MQHLENKHIKYKYNKSDTKEEKEKMIKLREEALKIAKFGEYAKAD